MIKHWKDILTREQEKQLIDSAVNALEKLVSSKETSDLLQDIKISERRLGDTVNHYKTLYLTKKGLNEKLFCGGHRESNSCDDGSHIEHCENYDQERRILEKDIKKIIKDYRLTETEITEIFVKIQA